MGNCCKTQKDIISELQVNTEKPQIIEFSLQSQQFPLIAKFIVYCICRNKLELSYQLELNQEQLQLQIEEIFSLVEDSFKKNHKENHQIQKMKLLFFNPQQKQIKVQKLIDLFPIYFKLVENFGKICIQTLKGKSFYVKFKPSTTIQALMNKIEKIQGVPYDKQKLIFEDNILEPNKTFADYKIDENSVITLSVKLQEKSSSLKSIQNFSFAEQPGLFAISLCHNGLCSLHKQKQFIVIGIGRFQILDEQQNMVCSQCASQLKVERFYMKKCWYLYSGIYQEQEQIPNRKNPSFTSNNNNDNNINNKDNNDSVNKYILQQPNIKKLLSNKWQKINDEEIVDPFGNSHHKYQWISFNLQTQHLEKNRIQNFCIFCLKEFILGNVCELICGHFYHQECQNNFLRSQCHQTCMNEKFESQNFKNSSTETYSNKCPICQIQINL